jgi:hypothetical protein
VAGSTVTIVTAGTCTIAANAAADTNYNIAAQVTQSVTINKATQTISFGAQTSPRTYSSGGTFAISPVATTPSSSSIVYSSTTTGVCTVAGSTVTIVTAGTCTIAANAAADTNYNIAAQVTQSVTINKATQTISFGAQTSPRTYSSGGTFAISPVATTPSSSSVVYSSTTTGVCTVAGSTVTIVTAGTCTIAANAAADTNYNIAAQVTQSVTINKATQTISFGAQTSPRTYSSGGTFAISPVATTPSSSSIVYSSTTTGVCTVAGSTVTIVTAGTCTIAANAAADTNYNVAAQVTKSIVINQASQTITVGTAAPASAAYGATFPVAATSTSGLTVAITVAGGCSISTGTVTIINMGISCTVYYNQAGNTNYSAASQVSSTTTVVQSAFPLDGSYKGSSMKENNNLL